MKETMLSRPAALVLTLGFGSALTFSAGAFAATDAEKARAIDFETVRLMKAGEDDKALIEIDKALKLPHGPLMEKRKADCLLNLGRAKEALVIAKQVEKLDPKDPEIHATLAHIYEAMLMVAEALKEMQIAVIAKPGDRGFRNEREKIYERQHEWAKAAEDLTIVINSSDVINRPRPLERRAICYMQLKDYPKAIVDLTAALTGRVGRSDLMRMRAQAYEKMGNHAAAQKDLQTANVLDGDFAPPTTMGDRQ